jgi:hypothetical protein
MYISYIPLFVINYNTTFQFDFSFFHMSFCYIFSIELSHAFLYLCESLQTKNENMALILYFNFL